MPYGLQHAKTRLPRRAASQIDYGEPVRASASQADYVLPAATAAAPVLGIALATAASPGDGVAVQTEGVAICRAGASVGPNTLLAVGTNTGRLYIASTGQQVVGESVNAAADGDYFSVLLKPRNPVA